jgi:hypothetical protein
MAVDAEDDHFVGGVHLGLLLGGEEKVGPHRCLGYWPSSWV